MNEPIRRSLTTISATGRGLVAVLALASSLSVPAAADALLEGECGGAVVCECGDRVVEDYVLTQNLGPCGWDTAQAPDELVGLRVDSSATLDCNGFSIIGPADARREEFGIRIGSSTKPVENARIKNCNVAGFWWGIYVTMSEDVVIEDSIAIANGWKSATENGTGYGIDIANSSDVIVRRTQVLDNGNEGIHLTGSTRVLLEDNILADNGYEQLYLIGADRNTIRRNDASGGRQSLEMRDSDSNEFQENFWRGSRRQWLENDNDLNRFVYDHFEGKLEIDDSSNGNRFEMCSLRNLSDVCAEITAANNVFFKSHFACEKDVDASSAVVLDRVVGVDKAKKKSALTKIFLGCSADMNGDGAVGPLDLAVVTLAMGSRPGDPTWNPEADLDHNGVVEPIDLGIGENQLGPCSFKNKPPKPILSFLVLVDNPSNQPDQIRLDASRSTDDSGIVGYDFQVENALTGQVLFARTLSGVPAAAAQVEVSLRPGKYAAYLIATDDLGVASKPKRKTFGVK